MYFYQSDVALQGQQVSENGAELIGFKLVGGGEILVTLEAVKEVVREEDYAFHVRNGDFWLRKGDRERALSYYSKALAMVPESAFVKRRIEQVAIIKLLDKCTDGLDVAKTLLEQKKYWGAIAEYERLLELEPPEEMKKSIILEMAETHAKIAYLYYDHVYEEGAEREVKEAKGLNPDCALAHYVSGRLLRDQGELEPAVNEFRHAYQLDPTLRAANDFLIDTNREIEKMEKRKEWVPLP